MPNFHFCVFIFMWGYHVLSFNPLMTPGLLIITGGGGGLIGSNIKFIHENTVALKGCFKLRCACV
jgi:hypothetical protein